VLRRGRPGYSMCDMSVLRARDGHRAGRRLIPATTAAVALVAASAAVSEGAIALGVVGLHASSGGWDMRSIIVAAASLTLFVVGPALAASALTPSADAFRPVLLAAAIATAAAVVARYFAYDSYYYPLHRRMSDGGILPGWWIVLVAALALAAAGLSFRNVRASVTLAGAAMFLAGPTILIAAAGH
jgi:hypothetical protein